MTMKNLQLKRKKTKSDRLAVLAAVALVAPSLVSCSGFPGGEEPAGSQYKSKEWQAQSDWWESQEDGDFLVYVRRFDKAEDVLKVAVARAEKFGKGDPRLARSMRSLARVYLERNEYDKAAELLESSLAIKERAVGRSSSEVADIKTDLALAYAFQGKPEEARKQADEALAVRRLYDNKLDMAETTYVEAILLAQAGDRAGAEKNYDMVIKTFSEQMKSSDSVPSTALINKLRSALMSEVDILKEMGKTDKSKQRKEQYDHVQLWLATLGETGT